MRKSYILSVLTLLVATLFQSAIAQITVFSDNFDRSSFVTGSSYGTPATLYKFSTGGTSTITTSLVSGSNYRANLNSGSTAQNARFYAPLAPFSAPFSRILSANPGLVTWTFNMRTSTAVTSTTPLNGVMEGGIDLCSDKAGNIYNGLPSGYAVVFNSSATGGVALVRFNAGMNSNTVLITQTTTVSKTNYYSVRVTYDPATNQWALYMRNDGTTGFADPSTGVTQQQGSTITDATYTGIVTVNYGALYTFTAGTGKTMSVDNFQVTVTLPPCSAPGVPTSLSYTNTATSTSVSFAPPSTAPTGYILVMSSGPLTGLPTTGQSVAVGASVGTNGTIVGVGSSSPVATTTPLTANTTYTFTLFPYNVSGCTGGPVFNTSVTSTDVTTCPNAPTLTSVGTPTAITIPDVTWDPPATGGGVFSSYTYLINVYTDAGLSVPAPGYPIEGTVVTSPYTITGLTSGVTYWYTITAVDAACNSAPSASNNVITSVVPCSGLPTAGTASSTSAMVTGANPFTLSLVGASGETGISFQWQSSSCRATWANVGSSSSTPIFPTTESAATYYRCVVTCANSGLSSNSSAVYVGRTNTTYCNPASTNGCSAGDGVNSFVMAGACGTSINDAGPMLCSGINIDHTYLSPLKLYAGSSYAAHINSQTDGDDVFVWIDFNNSGTFDASELVYSTSGGELVGAPYFYNFSIPIPTIAAGAIPGVHRMRVIANNAQAITTGCTTLNFGTSVDYMVQIIPNVSLAYNAPVCLPGGLTLTASPSISCGGEYVWAGPFGYSNVTENVNVTTPPPSAGVYTVSVNVNGVNSCSTGPITTAVTIFTAPTVTGISGMCVGSTATLSGTPGGGTWTSSNAGVASVVSGSGLATGVALGAANITYTVPSTGCTAVKPLAITPPPTVFAVNGGGSLCAGAAGVRVGIAGSTSGVSYQLYNGGVPTGMFVTGTGAAVDFGFINTAGTYTVVGNPGTSCATTMGGSATVIVNPAPTLFNVNGGGSYCVGGTGVHVGLNGTEAGINYQLYANGMADGAVYPGTGAAADFGLQTITGTYNVIATNTGTGCSSVMSSTATVAMYPQLDLYSVTGGGPVCVGSAGAHIGTDGSTTGVNYQLYFGAVPTGSAVAGNGSALDFGVFTAAGNYTVMATVAATGCTRAMNGSVAIVVYPASAVYNVTGGGAYCAGGTGVSIGLNGSQPSCTYSLYNGPSLVTAIGGTGAALDFGLQTGGGIYTITALNVATGCVTAMTGNAVVTVNSLPLPYNVTGGGAYCAGATVPHLLLSGSTPGISYQLMSAGSPVGSAITGTGSGLDFGAQPVAATYNVVATNPGSACVNMMNGSIAVSVNPVPSGYLVTGGGSLCAGGTGVAIGLNGSDSGISYQLQLAGVNTGLAQAGTGAALNFVPQSSAGTYNVIATNVATLCASNMPGTATVVVKPLPLAYTVTGGGNYCAGGTGISVGLNGSESGISYQLYEGTATAGPSVTGTGAALDFGLQTAGGNYTVSATNTSTGCMSTMNGSAVVGIVALPVAFDVTGGGSVCPGGAGLHIGLSNSATGVNYQLYNGSVPTGTAVAGTGISLDLGTQSAAGTYYVIGTSGSSTCATTMNGSATINIAPLPVLHNVTGGGSFSCVGGLGATVGLDGSSVGVSYQLHRAGVLVGAPLAGTGGALDFGLQTVGGTYTVVATDNATGCDRDMLGSAIIVVIGQPAIKVLTGGGNYCPGTTGVHIGLNGSETGVYYQVYKGVASAGSPVSGTGAALDMGIYADAGTYTINATNIASGCSVAMAGTTTVGMSAMPLVYAVSGDGVYCAGEAGNHVLLGGSSVGTNYELFKDGVTTGSVIAGTGSPLDFGIHNSGHYTMTATNTATTCMNNMAGSATIVMNPLPLAFTVSGGGSYCAGGAGLPIVLSGSQTGVSYQLLAAGAGTGMYLSGTGAALDFGPQTAAGDYTVAAVNTATGCANAMSGAGTIHIISRPAVYTVGGGGNYCTAGAGLPVTLSGSTSSILYELYNGTTLATAPIYGTGSALNFGNQTAAGTYTIKASDLTSGCTVMMGGNATIGLLPVPAAYSVSGGGAVCPGGTGVAIGLAGSAVGATYQLYKDGVAAGSPVTGSGSAVGFGLQTAAGGYTVVATNTANGCTSYMTGTASVTAGTLPLLNTVTGSSTSGYCSGGAGVTIYLNSSEPGVSYQLYRGAVAVGSPVSGTLAALSFGAQPVAGLYTVGATNTTTGCQLMMSGSVSVFVNALPDVYNVTGGGIFCAGGAGAAIALDGSHAGVTYQLYHGVDAVGLSVAGTGSALDMGTHAVPGSYTVTATNVANGCSVNMNGSAMVNTSAAATAYTVTGGGTFCAGSTGSHVGLNGSHTGISYQLYNGSGLSGSAIAGSGGSLDFGAQTTSGVYTVIATNTSTGCTTHMNGSAVVNAVPLPTGYPVTGGGAFCAGGTGVHIGLAASATGVSYNLYKGATLVSTVAGSGLPIDFGTITTAGGYTVIGKDVASSCISNMPGGATVVVNSNPDIYAVAGGGSYCDGGTGVHISLSGSTPGVEYTLYNGASIAGVYTGGGTMLDFGSLLSAGSYTVKATNAGTGCSSYMAGSATVSVSPVVVPAVSITTSGGGALCAGSLATFTADAVNAGSTPGMQWTVNGVPTGTAMSYSYIPVNGDVIGVTLNSAAVCAVPASVSATSALTVLNTFTPEVTVSANPGVEVCQGSTIAFTALPAHGGTAPAYVWMNGTTVIGAGATFTYAPAAGDVVSCKMTSNYECRLANTAVSAPETIVIDTPATPVVTIDAYPGVHVMAGTAVTLQANVVHGGPSPHYQWAVNGADVAGANSPSFVSSTFADGDIVSCNVMSSGGCASVAGSQSVTFSVSGVGVAAIVPATTDVHLIPNPNNGNFTITGALGADDKEATIEVVNPIGQVIYSSKAIIAGGRINEPVQLSSTVANGMYIVNVRTLSGVNVFHVVVSR